jgi:CO/xanthine dehydrogenase FAD-binding subunit
MRPQGVALPILNMATRIHRQGEVIAGVRLALGPAGKKPLRAFAAERILLGGSLNDELISKAEEAMLSEAVFRTSRLRASATYRRYLSGYLLRETLIRAWERATKNANA